MKIKILLLATILILLAVGTVSAEENVTVDNMTDEIEVTFDDAMWQENLTDINVELPENASGYFAIKVDDEVIYNQTIVEKSFKVPARLPERGHELYVSIYPPIDCKFYKVSAFYNGIDLNINKTLKVMRFAPDYNILHFPEEILQDDSYFGLITFPRSAKGDVEFLIDNKLFNKTTAKPTIYWQANPFSGLSLGNHTFKVIYHGDSYYLPYNKTFNFTVTRAVITIPKRINIGHDDCISVRTLKNVQGNVKVYIDNQLICNSNVEDGDFILSLEKYIKYSNREIKVVYTGKDFTRTKTQELNMTYDFDVWPKTLFYGQENIIEIILPDTLNNNLLKIMIDGKLHPFKRSTTVNNIIEVDVSGFESGKHSMCVSYPGDGKYYPLDRTFNFTITYHIHIPNMFDYKSQEKAYLMLPGDADGNLEIYVDGKFYSSSKLNNGYAEVKLGLLNPGIHDITAKYNGSDYAINDQDARVYVAPIICVKYRFTAGEDEYITLEVSKDCKGYVIFDVDEREYRVNVKDGIARFSLKNLNVGEHDIYVNYYGDDGFEDISNWFVVEAYKPKIKYMALEVSFNGICVKLKLLAKNGKVLVNKKLKIRFNGKTYTVKTNGKGIAILKKSQKLKKKKYILKISYMGSTVTKDLKLKKLSLKTKVCKGKIILTASINKKIKNMIVKLKVNSKTYKIKTNGKGIAKLVVKKFKRMVVRATYQKSTVKELIEI